MSGADSNHEQPTERWWQTGRWNTICMHGYMQRGLCGLQGGFVWILNSLFYKSRENW